MKEKRTVTSERNGDVVGVGNLQGRGGKEEKEAEKEKAGLRRGLNVGISVFARLERWGCG